MVTCGIGNKNSQERYFIPIYKSAFINFPNTTVTKDYLFHFCDFVKLDFYKFAPDYKGDSQEICLDTVIISNNRKVVFDNNNQIICFTTDSKNTDKKWSAIFVYFENTQFKKFCSYF